MWFVVVGWLVGVCLLFDSCRLCALRMLLFVVRCLFMFLVLVVCRVVVCCLLFVVCRVMRVVSCSLFVVSCVGVAACVVCR